jgi:hypothetical protein
MKEGNAVHQARKWVGYSGMATAFLAVAHETAGQVVYTDIGPDSVFTDGDFDIDLDHDALIDLSLHEDHFTYSSAVVHFASVGFPDGNQLAGSGISGYIYPAVLASGAVIGPDDPAFASYGAGVLAEGYPDAAYGNWPGRTGFLGCRFIAGDGGPHYGWVKLHISQNAGTCTVIGFGYESMPNTAITAGDMGAAAIAERPVAELGVKVVPNPLHGRATVVLPKNGQVPLKITILNGLGEELLSDEVTGTDVYPLDLSGYPAGIYFLRLQQGDRVAFHKVTKL